MITYDHRGTYLYYKEQIYNTREFYGARSFGCERVCGIFGVSLLFSQSMIALRSPLRFFLMSLHPVFFFAILHVQEHAGITLTDRPNSRMQY